MRERTADRERESERERDGQWLQQFLNYCLMIAEKEPAMFAFVAFLKLAISILINSRWTCSMSSSSPTALPPSHTIVGIIQCYGCIFRIEAILHYCFSVPPYFQHFDQKVFTSTTASCWFSGQITGLSHWVIILFCRGWWGEKKNILLACVQWNHSTVSFEYTQLLCVNGKLLDIVIHWSLNRANIFTSAVDWMLMTWTPQGLQFMRSLSQQVCLSHPIQKLKKNSSYFYLRHSW